MKRSAESYGDPGKWRKPSFSVAKFDSSFQEIWLKTYNGVILKGLNVPLEMFFLFVGDYFRVKNLESIHHRHPGNVTSCNLVPSRTFQGSTSGR